jgi:hypothetical protein
LEVSIAGPKKFCGGSYALVKVTQGVNATDFSHVFSFLSSTSLKTTELDQAKAGNFDDDDQPVQVYTLILPDPGHYDLTIDFQHRQHFGSLARLEGDGLPGFLGDTPALKTFDNFLEAPAACFEAGAASAQPLDSKLCCDCDEQRRYFQTPGYWTGGRTSFVPFFRPPADLEIRPSLEAHSPGGVMIAGSSRMRTIYYDIYNMVSHQKPDTSKLRDDAQQKVGDLVIYYNFLALDFDFELNEPGHLKAGGKDCTSSCAHLEAALVSGGFCKKNDAAALRSTVILGSPPAASSLLSPNDLESSVNLKEKHIKFLADRCKDTNTLVLLAEEMGVNDQGRRPTSESGLPMYLGNGLTDNRNFLLSLAQTKIARKHGVAVLGAYAVSKSAGIKQGGSDIAHYYKGGEAGLIGDDVSRMEAALFVEAIEFLMTK